MRYCFSLQVRPDRLQEYADRHARVWPEMRDALRDSGWDNYSLFLRGDGLLIGYVETDDLQAAQQAMDSTEVNARWQADMAGFFLGTDGRPPDRSMTLLTEVFHLDGTAEADPRGTTVMTDMHADHEGSPRRSAEPRRPGEAGPADPSGVRVGEPGHLGRVRMA